MRVCIDMGADLCPAQAQLTNATFQFAGRQIRILHGDGRQSREPLWMIADDFGDVIVQPARKVERVGWLRPITEHDRDGRKHLQRNSVAVALLDATLGIPHIVGDLAKDAVAHHHPRAARFVVLEPDEAAVAVFRVEIGPIARQDVRVQIDLHK